jgi:hypothetical protein
MPTIDHPRGSKGPLGALHRDQRGVALTGYMVRVVVSFVILIGLVYETGQVAMAQIQANNAAGSAAQAGADSFALHKNANKAALAADEDLKLFNPKARLLSFSIARDGTVTVGVSVQAKTVLLQHLPFISKYQTQVATQSQIHSLASTR